ncbi:MAG: M20 metallopeptidase family protein [Thermoplasmata archaeon]
MASGRGGYVAAARRLLPKMRSWRESIHREPEPSNEERATRDKITAALDDLEISYRTYDDGFYGVLGVIPSKRRGPVVALRADMDALPVTEATGLPFASSVTGRMHACGHDVHMSALLGAAAILAERSERLRGAVKLVFQPAEEQGADGGALPFLRRGCFRDPSVDFVVGEHVEPGIPAGTIGIKPGACMAAADTVKITVHGRGGHAASPHQGPDAVLVASEIVTGLQALVSRVRNPVDPVVISIGSIHGGTRHNILPDRVVLEGTVRTFRPATRAHMEEALRRRVRAIAASLQARVTISYEAGYPALWNPPRETAIVGTALRAELGASRVVELEHPIMGAEDFARYLERVPGTFLRLGAGIAGRPASLHSSTFAPPEESLVTGAAALAASVGALQVAGR